MTSASPPSPSEASVLRPLILARIEQLPAEDLPLIDRTLLELETRRLSDELGAALAEDWRSGRITEESIAEAVREHRQKHPYR